MRRCYICNKKLEYQDSYYKIGRCRECSKWYFWTSRWSKRPHREVMEKVKQVKAQAELLELVLDEAGPEEIAEKISELVRKG